MSSSSAGTFCRTAAATLSSNGSTSVANISSSLRAARSNCSLVGFPSSPRGETPTRLKATVDLNASIAFGPTVVRIPSAV